MIHELTIQGQPISKMRPRFANRGRYVKVYSAQETEEGRTWLEIKSQWGREPLEGPVILKMMFTFKIPASTSKLNRGLMECNKIRHCKKPDIDNCAKYYLDVMNGLVFKDDSQVWGIQAWKAWGDPGTHIVVEWNDIPNVV